MENMKIGHSTVPYKRAYIDIPVSITNKCPNCGERYLSDGHNTVTVGEKVVCELCHREFEIELVRNVMAQREINKSQFNQPEITDPRATIIECLDKLSRATKMLLEVNNE